MNFKRFVIAWRRFLRNTNSQTGKDAPIPCLLIETNKEVFMPRGDGTGPTGAGPAGGKRSGKGGQGGSKGRMGGSGLGIGGDCTCPQCGTTARHERGKPCLQQKCPQCGAPMVRA